MDDEAFRRLLVKASRVELTVERYYHPDGGFADGYHGPELVVTVFAERLAAMTAAGRSARELRWETTDAIVAAATAACGEPVRTGMDTAVGRTMTHLGLRVDGARGPTEWRRGSATINHLAT